MPIVLIKSWIGKSIMKTKKHVVITGVAGGIGREMANEFLKNGFFVSGLDCVNSSFQELEKSGISCYQADLTDEDESFRTYQKIEADRKVDIWINNAGISQIGPFQDHTDEDLKKIFDINFFSLAQSTRYWINLFNSKKREGLIVNIASAAGHVPSSKLSHYVSTKFAVVGLTQSLQIESEELNWHAKLILVSPGFVKTPLMKIGEKNGFPKKFEFLISDPVDCAKSIVDGIIAKKEHIIPNASGKAFIALRRLSPSLTNFVSKMTGKEIK